MVEADWIRAVLSVTGIVLVDRPETSLCIADSSRFRRAV